MTPLLQRLLRLALIACICAPSLHADDELVILSPHWEGIRNEFARAFKARYVADTGRTVELKMLDVGGTSDIMRFIRSEFSNKPDGIGIDIFFGGGTDPYIELKRLALLAPYRMPDAILDGMPATIGGVDLYDPEHHWYAATLAGFGIVYNKVVLEKLGLPEPSTWDTLAEPRCYSWVGSADPRKSGSVHMAYEIILQAYGWERGWDLIGALGSNVRAFTSASSQTPQDVAVGEVAYGLAIDFYAWAQVREHGPDNIGFVMPQDLTVINGDAIAMLRGAPNPSVAEHFMRFVLSDEGQKLWMLRQGEDGGPVDYELGRFSVRPALYAEVGERTSVRQNPFTWSSDFIYDSDLASSRWGVVNDLIGAFVIDAHGALTRTRRQTLEQEDPNAALSTRFRIPIDLEEASALGSDGRWRDTSYRAKTLSTWSRMAREHYGDGGRAISIWRQAPSVLVLIFFISMVWNARRSRRYR